MVNQSLFYRKTIRVVRFLYLLVLITLPQSTIISQTHTESIRMDLLKAQQLALSHNPLIQATEKSLSQAESQILTARGRLLPNVSGFGSYTHNFELPVFTIDFQGQQQTLRAGTEENISTGIRLEQPIFMGGSIRSGVAIARAQSEMTLNQVGLQRQEILLAVRQAFYRTLYTQQLIQVAKESIRNAERNLEIVRRQSELGTASGFDVLRAEVQLANVHPQRIAAEHQHEQAMTALRTAIGLDPDRSIEIKGNLSRKYTELTDKGIKSLQKSAYANSLELQNIEMQRRIQRQNLAIARAHLLPKVSANALWQYQLQNENLVFEQEQFYRSIAGTVNLSVPIFTGWQNRSRIEQAQTGLKRISDLEQNMKHEIAAEVESAYHALVQAEEQLASQQETVGQARKSLQLAEIRFKEGTSTQLDVLNAQLALQQAQSNESQYLLQYNIAQDRLLKAMNMLNI